jgi:hypothetical protein
VYIKIKKLFWLGFVFCSPLSGAPGIHRLAIPYFEKLATTKSFEKETITPLAINTGRVGPAESIIRAQAGSWNWYNYVLINGVFDHQGGIEPDTTGFSSNSYLTVLQRSFTCGRLDFRAIFSVEPWTIGRSGYPLIFSTAGTSNGVTVLVDRFPAHELVSELGLSYCQYIGETSYAFAYFGIPGTPALGTLPTQRITDFYLPEGTISYSFLNSTDICYGVGTIGIRAHKVGLEGSIFTGREQDDRKWKFERPRFDSYAGRFYSYFGDHYIFQISGGFIKSPDELAPLVNVKRLTASLSYNKNWHCDNFFQITASFVHNRFNFGDPVSGFLLESCVNLRNHHIVSARFERIKPIDIIPLPTQNRVIDAAKLDNFHVGKVTAGYMFQLPCGNHVTTSVGGSINWSLVPKQLLNLYGKVPFSYFIFARVELI